VTVDERKRQRDDEAETEEDRREEEEEEEGRAEGEEEDEEHEEEEEEEEEATQVGEAKVDLAVHAADMLGRMHKVLRDKRLDVDENMSPRDRRALELLYMARMAQNETGDRAAAGDRMKYLTEALAWLQPVLAMARSPLLSKMHDELRDIREGVQKVRKDIRQKSSEIHNRKKRNAKEEGTDDAELSKDGQLADLVAELARKKRNRFAHDPRKHPVGLALERVTAELTALGKIAAAMSAIDRDRVRETDTAGKAELDRQWREQGAALAQRLAAFLAAPPAELADAFAPFAGEAAEMDAERAVRLAARVAQVMDQLLDNQDELVAQSAAPEGEQKRGFLGRLFGRKE
jgi:hypothetical protein